MIALSAVVAGVESVRRLLDPQPIERVGVVIAAGLIGFAGNELVALYRIRVGRPIGSAALVADGLHARTDGFTSLAVVGGALGVLAGFPIADPLVGLLITVAILFVLRGAATDVYRRLMDAVEPELVDAAEASLRATPGVLDVDEVRLRWIGHRIRAEVGLVVDGDLGHRRGARRRHRGPPPAAARRPPPGRRDGARQPERRARRRPPRGARAPPAGADRSGAVGPARRGYTAALTTREEHTCVAPDVPDCWALRWPSPAARRASG